MKKSHIAALLCAALFIFVLSACGGYKLAEDFDEKQVTRRAEAAVALANAPQFRYSGGILAP